MKMQQEFFEEEVRHGFYINPFMKRGWAAQMEVLQGIDDICRKYNIRWFSHYGTMLGAVRHGGFVPWDDDMDICMLREDYDHFAEALKQEHTELRLYGLRDDCEKDDFINLIARVMNSDRVLADRVMLDKYHECIFACGLDIFILDYVSKDPEFEKNRETLAASIQTFACNINEDNTVTDEIRHGMKDLEAIFDRTFDWKKPLDRQLYQMLDILYSGCPAEDRSDGVALLQEVYNDLKKPPFHVKGYDGYYEVPFEMMQVRLSKGFLEMMKIYYYNFALYWRGGGGHAYPFYEKQYELFTEHNMQIPFYYSFDPKDLPDAIRGDIEYPKENIRNTLTLIDKSFVIEEQLLKANEQASEETQKTLELMQQLSIQAGTVIESARGEDFPVVHMIEEFIEEIYQYYDFIQNRRGTSEEEYLIKFKNVQVFYEHIKNEIEEQYLHRREILLIPYRAKYWYAMKPIYDKLRRDKNTDVFVMPVPLHYRDAFGTFTNTFYEGDLYPTDVKITDYKAYNPGKRMPDEIYIGTDYDDNNPVISVEPAYYAENLVKCTPCLTYVPFMLLDENLGNEWLMEKELKLAGCQPGLMHVDKVYVQSENIKKHFLKVLKEFAGEDMLPVFEKKLVAEDYPVLDYIESLKTENPEKKPRIFYYLSIAGILYEDVSYLMALKAKVQELLADGDVVSLALENRAAVTLKTVDEALYHKTIDVLEEFSQIPGVRRIKEPESFEEQAAAVAQHDAYCGDQGPMTWLFQHYKKPIEINTVDYNKM